MTALKKIDPVEKILLEHNQITPDAIEEIRKNKLQNGKFLGRALVEHGYLHVQTLLETLSKDLGYPYITKEQYPRDQLPVPDLQFPEGYLKEKTVFPLAVENGSLTLAVFDPFDWSTFEDLKISTGKDIKLTLSAPEDIQEAIENYYGLGGSAMDRMVGDISDEDADLDQDWENTEHIRDMASEAPVIKLVNHIINQAIETGASDIHLEPFMEELALRYRIDGMLYDFEAPPKRLQSAISTRIKIMAKLDISERRLPQDGKIRVKTQGKDIDIRVSTLPTIYGESVVMRILDRGNIVVDLEHLGFPKKELELFQQLIKKPYGMILVTGPTGSGKTTTLYAGLSKINTPDKKIVTIEDPVEYQLRGINQIHVKPQIGLTFANGLRSIVRQDPDVIMIGEIRDPETADIAIQAALTGHLVFSTVHTNDAAGAITRLQDMGVESFLLSSAVLGVLAQRLVRVICTECKVSYELDNETKSELGIKKDRSVKAYRGTGCKNCNTTGYKGRMGIYELLIIDDSIRKLILTKSGAQTIRDRGRKLGMNVLREDGLRKVIRGLTTVEEIMRVTQADQVG
ncbi:MAG: type II secretion system ATPase GspE [Candidatus Nitronauta litoralis]|uniref:protein-secreting ATPase n=1 Tax=Candidatus Nitronauta litoralis TaxID=2705533 RepID=A0A7T0G0W3_9BACT|nr:MAG: type II secretion system ATPase GspE [Candidatus Nitronauta litoralis]